MHAIIDSPYNLGAYASALAAAGVKSVIRYYNNRNSATFPSKCLTAEELEKLELAELNVAVIFQQRGGAGGNLDDLTAATGRRDATRAVALAQSLGQPEGSAIYFGVDHDFFRPTELASIVAYFSAAQEVIDGRFKIGVYGSGAVCKRLRTEGVASYFWLPASMGWAGSRDFLREGGWTLFQKYQDLQADIGRFDYDGNEFNPAFADFGQFRRTGSIQAQDRPIETISGPVAIFEVSARRGLNLRRGPGETFGIEQALPYGTVVHGLGQEGSWIQVDLDGDHRADGFMKREFLRPLTGGLPLPEPAVLDPYGTAKRELAMNIVEVPGPGNNPRIVLYHSSTSGGSAPDATAWCSSFVNYCVEQAGLTGTDSKWARTWHDEDWGEDVTENPREGDIVVWRRRGAHGDGGHVGFYVSETETNIRVLGGNQSNRVSIAPYPKNGRLGTTRYSLLSIRR
jgi:uncharacterized protein (TIGR02594 family)